MKNIKALGIVSSPRKDGNSAYLLKEVCNNLKPKLEVQILYLKDYAIESCKECYYCVEHNTCVIQDYMQEIYSLLKESDVILLSSPIFMGGIASRMRILMERTWHLRKGQLKGKIGSYILAGRRDLGAGLNEMEEYLSRLKVYKIPGVFGFGLHKGDVQKDDEAIKDVKRLSDQILKLLGV